MREYWVQFLIDHPEAADVPLIKALQAFYWYSRRDFERAETVLCAAVSREEVPDA